MVKKVIICISVCVVLVAASFFTGAITTKHRLVEQYRVQFEMARRRADALTDTITRAREESSNIRESLSRQRTSVSELRELISEVRKHYEAMENILNSNGDNNGSTRDNDSSRISDIAE